ncbi:MAG: phosphoribosyltransferase family protein [Candidatus Buchananbacteria bacterium]|nr:phosphoribosyltransferase family protein [Candidatus Buchananbacteria bacterium]
MFFENRIDAGEKLAQVFIKGGEDWSDYQVIGLARGGVITALQIAQALNLPLSALCVDDLNTSIGFFVITGLKDYGLFYPNKGNVGPEFLSLSSRFSNLEKIEGFLEFQTKLKARQELFNSGQELCLGARVIVVDDGLVSGKSAFAAIMALKTGGVKEIVLAVPVVLPWLMEKDYGFRVITWRISKLKGAATGLFYYNFGDTSDKEVIDAVLSCRDTSEV